MAGGSAPISQVSSLLLRVTAPVFAEFRQRLGLEALPLLGHVADLSGYHQGNAAAALRLYSGVFHFAGHSRSSGADKVFAIKDAPRGWMSHLHGFAWLGDLQATGLDLHRVFARKLTRCWMANTVRSDFDTTSLRVLALARHGEFLMTRASEDFRQQFLSHVAGDIRRLTQTRVKSAEQALLQSAAVLAGAICFGGPERLVGEAVARLAAAAGNVILADGGHVSRSPSRLVETLELLLPIRQLMARRRIEIPQELIAAIERALAMLRMLCHGDGGLSLLQGGSSPRTGLVRRMLGEAPAMSRPALLARQSGFARLGLGASVVLVDCGAGGTCDGSLAIEFSDRGNRILGPCGVPQSASAEWIAAASQAAAQSALHVAQAAPVALNRFFRRVRPKTGNDDVVADLITSPQGMLFKGTSLRHAAVGMRHHRELFLSSDGRDFRGEDRLSRIGPAESGSGDWPFVIRFHVHPSADARLTREGGPVAITTADGSNWQFSARGGNLSLEDSVFLATDGPAQTCRQITIRGASGRTDIVNWALRRQEPAAS